MNPLRQLHDHGQSVWLDYVRRSLVASGELQRLVDEDGLRGVTSNPTIFQKAIAGSGDYEDALRELLAARPEADAAHLFEWLAIEDVRGAADVLRPVWESSDGVDGMVSLEVSPHLARDTRGTLDEARRLWREVDRPNLMVKVPATRAGLPAIETLVAEGINVNVTLMFSIEHYEAVVRAYLGGLTHCHEPDKVASVASFFVSRVDTVVDAALDEIGDDEARALRGEVAVANCRRVYRRFREIFDGDLFARLRERGARPQRLLWASTSTKDPAYRDVKYVEELVGRDTVNTMPPETLDAFRDHGRVRADAVEEGTARRAGAAGGGNPPATGEAGEAAPGEGREEAVDPVPGDGPEAAGEGAPAPGEPAAILERLAALGIDLEAVTRQLQEDGVQAFADSWDELLETLEDRRRGVLAGEDDPVVLHLGGHEAAVEERLETWHEADVGGRIWRRDPGVWAEEPVDEITDRLGWLDLPTSMQEEVDDLTAFADEVRDGGIQAVVLLGMGGSSLAPEVFQATFGDGARGAPRLTVLDSTHPGAVRALDDRLDLTRTLFVVSSKSGTTVETLSLFRHFWKRVTDADLDAGRHFVAITDPGSPLEELAGERGFRRVFRARPDVGGRYSALSHFGLVPAALVGADVAGLLEEARTMVEACAFCVDEADNPGLVLGAALGELAAAGRDKLTFLTSPQLAAFPDWIEQLVAESTGKDGTGIVPVVQESAGPPEIYGDDRLFVAIELAGSGTADGCDDDGDLARRLEELRDAGHPTVHVRLDDRTQLGRELFRWELAVAAAGAALGIHPFDQPDVELAKRLAKEAMKDPGEMDRATEKAPVRADRDELADALAEWLGAARPGDYVAVHAYLAPDAATTDALQRIRLRLRDRTRLATTLGYGPRFLHSTGQLHKGGPDTGLFLQIVDEPRESVELPETGSTFAELIAAQALGDARALRQRGRRVLRVQLGDAAAGLALLEEALAVESPAR